MTLLNGSLPADIPRRLLHWVLGIIIWLLLARLSSSYFSCQMCNLELSMDFFLLVSYGIIATDVLTVSKGVLFQRAWGGILSPSLYVNGWHTYLKENWGWLHILHRNKPSYSSVNLSQYSTAWRIGIFFVNIKSVYICIYLRRFPNFSPFPFLNTEGDLCLIIK